MISFEAGLLGVQHGGIGREAESLLRALEVEQLPLTLLTWPGDKHPTSPSPRYSQRLPRRIALALGLISRRAIPLHTPRDSTLFLPQVLPFTQKQSRGSILVRVHDLFPLTHPEWFTAKAAALFKISLAELIKNNALFLSDSRASELELLRIYPKARSLGVLHCYIPPFSESESCGTCLGCTFESGEKFFISVGTIEPRKNYDFLIELAGKLPGIRIAIVGRLGWKSDETLRNLQGTSGLHYLGSICDGSLRKLYASATAFLSPSLDEGFNIPAFEAKRFGLPLILSDIPVHRELHPDEKLIAVRDISAWVNALRLSTFTRSARVLPTFEQYAAELKEVISRNRL